ncbi:MAG: NAD(P)-dependent oxidoreductase [Planctomycetales bacterium]|nr:NAD(P)-dependent oxidoreductase [Planctomycetales bacterium]
MSQSPKVTLGAPDTSQIVGLIGLGLIGTALTQLLVQAGYRVFGYDTFLPARQRFSELGGTTLSDAADVISRCSMVLLSLPDDSVASGVLRDVEMLLRPSQIIVDTSTGAPAGAQKMFRWLSAKGVRYVDATISGSSVQLAKQQATLFVGANDEDFQQLLPTFRVLAERFFHVGGPGSGAQMKLVTNLVLGLNRAALAEGLVYAASMGLDLMQVGQMLRESMAYSRIMDTKATKMIAKDFTVEARLSQHLKDVQLMLTDARETDTWLPLSETHARLLQHAVALGFGDLDNSAIYSALLQSEIKQ